MRLNSGPIIIVGGGISGLTIGNLLSGSGYKVIIIEKESQIGGLAKSFRYGDFTFDIGPHRFFTHNPKVLKFIRNVKGSDYKVISRNSAVHMRGRYYKWPLQPEMLFHLPIELTMKTAMDLFFTRRKKEIECRNFKQYIENLYGLTLYNSFFKDYNRKFFGIPNEQIHSNWAKESIGKAVIDKKISLSHLKDLLKFTFSPSLQKLKFLYPVRGIGSFCEKLGEIIKKNKGEILTDQEIKSIATSGDKIEAISLDNQLIYPDKIIWTGALPEICKLLNIKSPNLCYLHLIIFNLELNTPVKQDYQWTYFGSKDLCFNRVTIPSTFSDYLVPKGKGSLCVEVTFNDIDKGNQTVDPWAFLPQVIEDLEKVNFINSSKDIKSVHTEIVYNAYPIYSLQYKQSLEDCLFKLSQFYNLFLNGRTALFWYNNMDECIENGINLVQDIIKG